MNQSAPIVLSRSTLLVLGALVATLVAGFVALALSGRDTATYALFVSGPIVTAVVGAVIGRRVTDVELVARTVERQTNGLLSNQIANIHEHLDEQTRELATTLQESPAAQPATPLPAPRDSRLRVQPIPVQDGPGL